jgi:hypothetical protein
LKGGQFIKLTISTCFYLFWLPCRQLGIGLHELGEQLPLLDTATGQLVPSELDASVEK